MRDVNIQQLIFLALVILLPLLEQVLKRRRPQPPDPPLEQEPEFEIEDFRDREEPPVPEPVPTYEERVERPPVRSSYDEVERMPAPAPVPMPSPVLVRFTPPVPVAAAPVRGVAAVSRSRRVPRISASEARRGVVMMEVLGPCVSMRDRPM